MNKQARHHVWLAAVSLIILCCGLVPGLRAQPCVSPPAGLVAWWPGDGNTTDIAGGHNGTWVYEGPITPPPDPAKYSPGKVGQAFRFEGINWNSPGAGGNYVRVADDPAWTLADKPFTFDLWVNFTTVQYRSLFLAHDWSGGPYPKFIFWYDAQGEPVDPLPSGPALRFGINARFRNPFGPTTTVAAPWTPVPGQWYHVAVTRQGTLYTLYIDGVAVASNNDDKVIQDPPPGIPFTIGAAEGYYFNGLLDEIELFNRALTASEISAIYGAGGAGKCKPGSDSTPPSTTATLTPAPGPGGWNTTSVSGLLVAADEPGGSGVKQIAYAVGAAGWQTQTGDTASFAVTTPGLTPVRFRATDNAGNVEQEKTLEVKIDLTPPVIGSVPTPSPNANGWNNSPVTVTWNVADPESGIVSSSGCAPLTVASDTPGATFTCTATDGAGQSSSSSVTVKLDATPPAIAASRSPQPNTAGWNNTDVTASFSCSDGTSGVSSLSPVSAVVSTEGANQSVTAICQDRAGNGSTATLAGISIDKTSPTATNAAANPNPVAVNAAVTLSASLSDTGGSNLTAAEYSVNGSAPVILSAAGGSSAQVSAAIPPFSAAGVYNVCVHGRDAAGNVGADDCLFLPAYDPSGGFVTGGGWINSPAGAYAANPGLTGKATFGFVSKYQHGANVPSGDTQFQFHVANLNFKSTAYEWLVIAGARAQYKGSGTINGAGSYQFLLTAIDGQMPGGQGVDRFRIKIWSAGGMVYDNQMGADDNSDPTTALGGGSIVIHKE